MNARLSGQAPSLIIPSKRIDRQKIRDIVPVFRFSFHHFNVSLFSRLINPYFESRMRSVKLRFFVFTGERGEGVAEG